VYLLSTSIYLFVSLLLGFFFSPFTALVYSTLLAGASSLKWTSTYTLIMHMMDREEKRGASEYALVCDNELFFNIGRIFAMLLFVGCWYVWPDLAVRWAPFGITLVLIAAIPVVRTLQTMVNTDSVEE
jgi:hypothetical protein